MMPDEPPSRSARSIAGRATTASSERRGFGVTGWFRRLMEGLRGLCQGHPEDREALRALLREAEQRSLLGADTLAMIEGAMGVAELRVRDIMVPRADMVVVRRDMSPEAMLPVIVESGHSRFPVVGDSRDELIGILLAKDLLRYFQQQSSGDADAADFDLKDLLRSPVLVPESKRLNVLLAEFRASRNHMAVVVDEFAGIAGLVTIEDVLEQIVGEIDDEHDVDDEEGDIRQHSERRFSVKARTLVEDFNDSFGSDFSDEEFDTVGGLVMHAFGHMPERGESVRLGDFDFKVLRADSRRLHLLRVTKGLPPETPTP